MTRAVDLLRNKFGVSQLYKHDVKQDDEIILTIYWHPLTIAERESIQKKSSDGDRASLRREVEASVLQEIQLAMINAGADKEVEEAKADLKS